MIIDKNDLLPCENIIVVCSDSFKVVWDFQMKQNLTFDYARWLVSVQPQQITELKESKWDRATTTEGLAHAWKVSAYQSAWQILIPRHRVSAECLETPMSRHCDVTLICLCCKDPWAAHFCLKVREYFPLCICEVGAPSASWAARRSVSGMLRNSHLSLLHFLKFYNVVENEHICTQRTTQAKWIQF